MTMQLHNGHAQHIETAIVPSQAASAGLAAITPRSLQDVELLAAKAHKSGMYGVKSAEDAFMRIATGLELGLSASQALRGIHVFSGKPTLAADTMLAVCQRSPLCETFACVESSATKATYVAKRVGQPETRLTWTIEEAKAAKLDGKDNWRMYPAAMLRARCIAALARMVFADLLLGLYTPEEMGDAQPARTVEAQVVPVTADGELLDDATALAADLEQRIRAAESLDALAALAADVKAARLPGDAKNGLRAIYAERKAALAEVAS